jgi:hypothetical protein
MIHTRLLCVIAVSFLCLFTACTNPDASRELDIRSTEAAIRQTELAVEQTRLALDQAPTALELQTLTPAFAPSDTPNPTATHTETPTLTLTRQSVEIPLTADEILGLFLGFESEFFGLDDEINLSGSKLSFVPGISGQAIRFNSTARLSYPSTGNINPARGAIEFWLKPEWPGNDEQGYVFFEVGDTWFNRFRVMKDGANNFRFLVWDAENEYGVACSVSHWIANEWHYIRAVWHTDTLALYLDQVLCATQTEVRMPEALTAPIYVGSAFIEEFYANAVMDEFAIYLTPDDCGQDFTRLMIGSDARITDEVSDGNPVYARPDADRAPIAKALESLTVTIVSGPVCEDGLVFWKVTGTFLPPQGGWIPEGDGTSYWLELAR